MERRIVTCVVGHGRPAIDCASPDVEVAPLARAQRKPAQDPHEFRALAFAGDAPSRLRARPSVGALRADASKTRGSTKNYWFDIRKVLKREREAARSADHLFANGRPGARVICTCCTARLARRSQDARPVLRPTTQRYVPGLSVITPAG